MEFKNMKQKEIERVEVYYERIQKLVHGLQIPTTDSFLTIVFKAGLQSYLNCDYRDEEVTTTTT
jgi:hypothetical protein